VLPTAGALERILEASGYLALAGTTPGGVDAGDVLHAWFVPALYVKQDAVPGRTILVWFEATKPGKYELPCAELCGFGHSGMKGWLYVHTADEYKKWADEHLAPTPQAQPEAPAPSEAPAQPSKS
jgi:cytochrome c oxidase subunit 2